MLHGAEDGASLAASTKGQESHFMGGYTCKVLPRIGHSVQLEQPNSVVKALMSGL